MTGSVRKFILQLVQQKANLPKNTDLEQLNYIKTGYVDSIGLIKFILEIESKYDIRFFDEEIVSSEFQTIAGLERIIARKIATHREQ